MNQNVFNPNYESRVLFLTTEGISILESGVGCHDNRGVFLNDRVGVMTTNVFPILLMSQGWCHDNRSYLLL